MRKKPPKLPNAKTSRAKRKSAQLQAADVLAFLNSEPGPLTKRSIAKALGVKGNDKIALKAMLKKAGHTTKLPSTEAASSNILEVEVSHLDHDGEAFARPVHWNDARNGPLPTFPVVHDGKAAAAGIGDRFLGRIEPYVGHGPYTHQARLLRNLTFQAARVVGIFRKSSAAGGRIVPSGKKDRDDYLVPKGEELNAKDGELVLGEVLRQAGRGLPQARVREVLGKADNPRNTSLLAIHTHGISDVFSSRVLDEVAGLKPFTRGGRQDLRQIPFITIDPADARDHDDAIWAERDPDPQNPEGFQIVIAIADVATYVRPGTALDREARKRGNSTYFPEHVVPMLPERISNDLCSLTEKTEKPALVCFITLGADGRKKAHRFVRATIRVAAGLSYEQAQSAIDGKVEHHLLEPVLKPLWAAYAAMSKARDARGPLDLDLPERKILLDDAGHVLKVVVPPRLDAHRLVEEFMIQANVAAAEQLNSKRTPLLFRVHEEPSTEKLRALQEFLRTTQIPFALGQVVRSRHFNQILSAAKDTPHQRVVNEVVLRSQAQANYSPQNAGHFGLALANYAHFTSPIRRYADLIVHRALITALNLGDDGLSTNDIAQLEETAELISAAERRSMLAERETVDRLIAAHLAEKLGTHFHGRISGVVSAGLFVVLNETGADGFIPASTLGREYFAFDASQHALIGTTSGESFQLGDDVEVRLMEVAPLKGGMRFEMISAGKPGKRPARNARQPRPKPKGRRRKS